jgi:hypothetical protein
MDNPHQQGNTATQIAAVKQLQQMHGRTILEAQRARQLTEPFGFVCETEFFTRNDNEEARHRVYFHDENTVFAEGQLVADVARQICHRLNVDYDFGGVESTRRSCCENLLKHLER